LERGRWRFARGQGRPLVLALPSAAERAGQVAAAYCSGH